MTTSMPTLGKLTNLGRSGAAGRPPRSIGEKAWLVGGLLVGVVIILIGYFGFVRGQQDSTNAVHSQIADANAQNSSLTARLQALKLQNRDLSKYTADLARANAALPSTADAAGFLTTLQSIGSATSTMVSGVTFSAPVAAAAAAPAAAPATDTASTPPAAVAPTASLYSMSISAQVSGSDAALERFLHQLQAVQPRAVLLTAVSQVAGGSTGGQSGAAPKAGDHTLSLSMMAFIAPTNLTVPTAATPSAVASTGSGG